jgi:hypothetical protein
MTSIVELLKELPDGYEAACYDEKAIQRKRGIDNPNDLMMLAMFHLFTGCSLVEISTIAELTKLGKVSDVAFMKRFEGCNNWFKWIIDKLIMVGSIENQKPDWLSNYRVLANDASDVVEKGRSGRVYRLHYALDIFNMQCAEYKITTETVGESLKNYDLQPNDLILADRMYSTFVGMRHCIERGANFVMRLRSNSFLMYDTQGQKIDLLKHLKTLEDTSKTLDLTVHVKMNGAETTPVRICAIKKDARSIEMTQRKLARKKIRKQEAISDETLAFNNYIVLVTMLPTTIAAGQVLELYRCRWQVEICFKRLKTIIDFGDLPKRRLESVFTWLNGKIMIALLIEKLIGKKPFPPEDKCEAECMA